MKVTEEYVARGKHLSACVLKEGERRKRKREMEGGTVRGKERERERERERENVRVIHSRHTNTHGGMTLEAKHVWKPPISAKRGERGEYTMLYCYTEDTHTPTCIHITVN